MTTEQITEALAWYRNAEPWHNEHSDVMAGVTERYAQGWVTCPTCNGEGLRRAASIPHEPVDVCPDCVDGLQPSAELIERVAVAMFDAPYEPGRGMGWYRRMSKAGLWASRQGDTQI